MLPFPICGSHLRINEGTAVGYIWVGWLSLTYPFLFPALLHFYSIKDAFIIYKRRTFEIGLVFSDTLRKEFRFILERAIEQAYAFFRFFIPFAKVLHNESKSNFRIIYMIDFREFEPIYHMHTAFLHFPLLHRAFSSKRMKKQGRRRVHTCKN